MQILAGLLGLLFIVSALIGVVRQPLTFNRRFWIAVQFLLAAILFWISPRVHRQIGFAPSEMDRSSVTASFDSISADGPQRQLVFHYMLENTTGHSFRIDPLACSTVSFRFTRTQQEPKPGPAPNPALHLP